MKRTYTFCMPEKTVTDDHTEKVVGNDATLATWKTIALMAFMRLTGENAANMRYRELMVRRPPKGNQYRYIEFEV